MWGRMAHAEARGGRSKAPGGGAINDTYPRNSDRRSEAPKGGAINDTYPRNSDRRSEAPEGGAINDRKRRDRQARRGAAAPARDAQTQARGSPLDRVVAHRGA